VEIIERHSDAKDEVREERFRDMWRDEQEKKERKERIE
jgi:hypothetical protein